MESALRSAGDDCGVQLLSSLDELIIPRGLWRHVDPGRQIAERVGAPNARTVSAEIGILQQAAINRACDEVSSGRARIVAVLGGESKWREQQASRAGIDLARPADLDGPGSDGSVPDIVLEPDGELWWQAEADRGLLMPVEHYAMCEQALRMAEGQSIADHAVELDVRTEIFHSVADANPAAWPHRLDPGPDHPALAVPYRKNHPSQWNVDQAAALIITTLGLVEELGIDRDRCVFPLAGVEANQLVPVSARAQMGRSQGFEEAFSAAFDVSGLSVDDLAHIDCYSCFPIAVRAQARALGISDTDASRPLTITGGMAFAGGPLNNYVLQAMVRLVELVRRDQAPAMSTSVSGMLNKQGAGIWGPTPSAEPYRTIDVTEATTAATGLKALDASATGPAEIASWTVVHQGGEPRRLIAICDTTNGRRAVAATERVDEVRLATEQDLARQPVELVPDGGLRLT